MPLQTRDRVQRALRPRLRPRPILPVSASPTPSRLITLARFRRPDVPDVYLAVNRAADDKAAIGRPRQLLAAKAGLGRAERSVVWGGGGAVEADSVVGHGGRCWWTCETVDE